MATIIEIDNLTHIFSDGTKGLNNINLTVTSGSFVVIAGSNGSGKTTLLRHLNGLLLPREGEVRIEGVPVEDDLLAARQKVGMVFQDTDSQIVGETVFEEIAFGPENLGLDRDEVHKRVTAAMKSVGLAHRADDRPHLLSGGQKRRLTIAGILAMEPAILVFDEPFSNLDYPGVLTVLRHIVSLHEQGHTILLITHDLEKVIYHADRLVIMQEGRVVRDDIPHHLFKELETLGVRQPCASRMGYQLQSWLG
ncbi:energy-coupling factor ABC transporter ATP-binding protein [Desulfopila sp. IMCC35008]|uniref:energy-coupling factor ABC transporter ATP-binding protein n=1 Tax=Desulfopila sp. IMCC35008 TaxID=2653858 RepID=UPI0013D2162B|nr:ABC transporter ATP-binding protein [Desulfopila sp. IMCC35008]